MRRRRGREKLAHWRDGVWGNGVGEERRFYQKGLMGREFGRGVGGADVQGHDGGSEIAVAKVLIRKRLLFFNSID